MIDYVNRILFDYHLIEGVKMTSIFFSLGVLTAYYLPPVVEFLAEGGFSWPFRFALVLGVLVAFVELSMHYFRRMEYE